MVAKKGNLKHYAYDEIKQRIVNCSFAPGIILNEQMLADEFKISRTPIREAFSKLQEEGLVTLMPKKGILVNNITISDMSEIYQVRLVLEPYIIRVSGSNLDSNELLKFRTLFDEEVIDGCLQQDTDTNFHGYLAASCNNKYIIQVMNKVLVDNQRVMISTRKKPRVESSKDEHIEIIDFLLKEDYVSASESMKKHIVNCRDSAFNFFIHSGNNL